MDWSEAFDSLSDKLQSWIETFILMLPNFVAAVVVVAAFALLARLTRKIVQRVMRSVSPYTHVNNLLATVAYVVVIATGVFIALGVLDLDKTLTSLLAGAGIIGLAVGFAFQDITANFISGILLTMRRPFREHDLIESNDYLGVVEELNLRSTILRTFEGQVVIIPNKEVFQNALTNYSRTGQRRIDLSCGVAYGDDLEKARRVAIEAMEGIGYRDQDRDVELFYDEFGGSSINFKLRFWIDFEQQTDYLEAQSEAIMRLKTAFDENDVTIPFPIRTLDFGVVGGEKLSDVLPRRLYDR